MRIVTLDYLRGIAALTVAASHYIMSVDASSIATWAAAIAVEAFFPLSGFVLASQINKIVDGDASLNRFLIRRWLRTIPPYLVALIAITILTKEGFGNNFIQYVTFTKYLFSSFAASDYYPIAWSLAIEEWYYVLFPIFLIACTPKKKSFGALIILTISLIAILIFIRKTSPQFVELSLLRISPIFRLDAICFGYLAFLLMNRFGLRILSALMICSLASLSFFNVFAFTEISFSDYGPAVLSIVPCFFGLLILMLVQFENTIRIQSTSLFRSIGIWLGRISYSTYLFHPLFIIWIAPDHLDIIPFSMYFMTIFCFGIVFYVGFEKPILNARPPLVPNPKRPQQ